MNYYEIYDGDDLLCVGSADACATSLGISRNAFYTMVFQNQDAKRPRYKIIETKSRRNKYPRANYYVVHLKKTREIIASGDAAHCAQVMNTTLHSFYSTVARVRSGENEKYVIECTSLEKEGSAKNGGPD